MAYSYAGAAEWVNELCLRLVGEDDTPAMRNLALAAAAATGASAPADNLITRGATFDGIGFLGDRSGLLFAGLRGHHELLRRLYTTHDSRGLNLFACVAAGLHDCAKDLIVSHGWVASDRNPIDSMDCTLLSLACTNGDVKIAKLLLSNGADPEQRWLTRPCDPSRQDPWLALLCSPRYVQKQGLPRSSPTTTLAARAKIVKLLSSVGSAPSAVALADAAGAGCADLFEEFLVASGDAKVAATAALPFAPDVTAVKRLLLAGGTARVAELINACRKKGARADVVCAIVASPGACSVNARDWQGRTALSWATLAVDVVLVKALLGSGADVSSRDRKGYTALDLALAARPTGFDDIDVEMRADWRARMDTVAHVLRLAHLQAPPAPLLLPPQPPPQGRGAMRRASSALERK